MDELGPVQKEIHENLDLAPISDISFQLKDSNTQVKSQESFENLKSKPRKRGRQSLNTKEELGPVQIEVHENIDLVPINDVSLKLK